MDSVEHHLGSQTPQGAWDIRNTHYIYVDVSIATVLFVLAGSKGKSLHSKRSAMNTYAKYMAMVSKSYTSMHLL